MKDFQLYLSHHAGLEVADFDEERWSDTLATKRADEEAAEAARRAREAAVAEAQKQQELKEQQAAAERQQAEQAQAAAVAQAKLQAEMAAVGAQSPGSPRPPPPVAPATQPTQPVFNAATQREMEARARAGVTAQSPRADVAFPAKFILTCMQCQKQMQAPKVRPMGVLRGQVSRITHRCCLCPTTDLQTADLLQLQDGYLCSGTSEP